MRRAVIGYKNRIDDATLSGGSWQAPIANIQNRRLAIKARSTNALEASTKFDIDFGAQQTIGIIGITGHNISLNGSWRITAGTAAGLSDRYDSGVVESFPAAYASMSLPFEAPNFWFGRLTEDERAEYTACNAIETPVVRAQYWRIEIFDASNAAGFIEIGRVFIGSKFETSKGFKVGATLGYNDSSQIMQSLQGVEYFSESPMARVATLTAPVMDKAEAFSGALEMIRQSGVTKEVMIIGDPDDAKEVLRQSFVGRLERLNPISQDAYDVNSLGLQIKEII